MVLVGALVQPLQAARCDLNALEIAGAEPIQDLARDRGAFLGELVGDGVWAGGYQVFTIASGTIENIAYGDPTNGVPAGNYAYSAIRRTAAIRRSGC
jgi:hypothetical protein